MTPRHSGSSTRNETKQRGIEGGFPHSEILGSKRVRSSPRLIAAYHVLHRLSAPRHPPNALKTLDRSHDPCAHPSRGTAHGPRTGPSRARRATGAVSCPCEPEDPHGQIKTRDDRRGTEAPPDRHLCRTRPGDRRCRRRWCPRRVHPLHDVKHRRRSLSFEANSALDGYSRPRHPSAPKAQDWWSRTGSNRRPHACKARALPTELRPHLSA